MLKEVKDVKQEDNEVHFVHSAKHKSYFRAQRHLQSDFKVHLKVIQKRIVKAGSPRIKEIPREMRVPKEIPKEIPKKVPKEIPKEMSKEIPKDLEKEM